MTNASGNGQPPQLRVALAYDLCSPFTVGGAETHYRGLAEALANRGHSVSYLTSRYWTGSSEQTHDGVRLVALTKHAGAPTGERTITAALRFGVGLFAHLLRRGGDYDVAEVAALPPTSAIAAWLGLLPHRHVRLVVDWHEVWRLRTWRDRFGAVGLLGWLTELLARRLGTPVSFSKLHATRLPGQVAIIPEFAAVKPSPLATQSSAPTAPPRDADKALILCVGRLVDDKRFATLPPTLAALESLDPQRNWSAVVVGSGPQRQAIEQQARRLHVADRIGFESDVSPERLSVLFTAATVLVHPSRREGFGIVVLEAATHSLPVIAVREPDNAAVELIADGINGAVVGSADPQLMAAAVARIASDPESKSLALEWWRANAHRFTADAAATAVEQVWQHTNIPPAHTPRVTVRNGLSKQLKNQSSKETHGISRDT